MCPFEVFSDLKTSAEQMFAQGQDMFTWIPNAYIKYPCTHEGLRAAQRSVGQGMRVNITLCFSQEQAAAVYAATKGTRNQPMSRLSLAGSMIKEKMASTS